LESIIIFHSYLIVFSEKDKEYFLSKNDLSLLYLKPVLLASLTIKSSKLGGVLLGKDLGFLDMPKILAVLDILFCHYSILGYYKDAEGIVLSLLISLHWYPCGLVGQKYCGWGYDIIDILYRRVVKGEKFPDWIDSGMDIITKKNVDAMIRAWLLKDFKTPLPPAF
jgi:hypothetical protein